MEFIKFKGVTKQYKNGVVAIYDLNLSIEKGDFCFIIGGSGSGKSTLIKMLVPMGYGIKIMPLKKSRRK